LVAGEDPLAEPQSADVLIVEDDSDLSSALVQVLELEGYRVSTAGDGGSALDILRRSPPPSLLLLDLSMPVMSGWEVCREIEGDARLRRIPVTIFTGSAARTLPHRAVDAGHLAKPVKVESLLEVVRAYCGVPSSAPTRR
jgi:CheY-like chemotaxis protein